jgi:hypothetical protein
MLDMGRESVSSFYMNDIQIVCLPHPNDIGKNISVLS